MKEYKITQEQFEQIQHFKRMFEIIADDLSGLCKDEKPDIVYGFELGKLHTYIRTYHLDMMNLEDDIRKQELPSPTKN